MSTWTAYAILALAWIGAAQIARWVGSAIGWAAWKIDSWSANRAFNLCGQAILDYEFERADALMARKFALYIMWKDVIA